MPALVARLVAPFLGAWTRRKGGAACNITGQAEGLHGDLLQAVRLEPTAPETPNFPSRSPFCLNLVRNCNPFADRTSTATPRANQLRRCFAAFASGRGGPDDQPRRGRNGRAQSGTKRQGAVGDGTAGRSRGRTKFRNAAARVRRVLPSRSGPGRNRSPGFRRTCGRLRKLPPPPKAEPVRMRAPFPGVHSQPFAFR